MTVKKPIIREWVKALRSGRYTQSTGRMKTLNRYCCLGVLCDIGTKGSWTDHGVFKSALGDSASMYLPDSVREYVGLSVDEMRLLWQMNDGKTPHGNPGEKKYSFAEIADYLEETFLGGDS